MEAVMGKTARKIAALCIVLAVISAYFWTEQGRTSGDQEVSRNTTHIALNAARPSCSVNGCSLTRSH